MNKYLKQLIQELHSGSLSGNELEEKEERLLAVFRRSDHPEELKALVAALAASGTILAVPSLFAVLKNNPDGIGPLAHYAILQIKDRSRKRGSRLPDDYFTPGHWQPIGHGTANAFLIFITAIAQITNRKTMVRQMLTASANYWSKKWTLISPYHKFEEFRICAGDWNFERDYKLVLEQIKHESVLAALEEAGITESWNTFFADNPRDLQYDYLLTRLSMADNFKYHRFVLKISACLNQKAGH